MADGDLVQLPWPDDAPHPLGRSIRHDPASRNFPAPRRAVPTKDKRHRVYGAKLDQDGIGACFPAGTLVRMADGSHRAIEDVRLLEEVVTAEGRTGRVLRTMVRWHDEGLTSVRLRGHNHFKATAEHPVLTEHGYVAAGELEVGDRVALTKYQPRDADPIPAKAAIDLSDYTGTVSGIVRNGGVESEIAPLPELLGYSPALGRLIGLYAAEGNVTAAKVVWNYGGHEEETLVAETVALVKTVTGATPRVQKRPNGAINVVLSGVPWQRLFTTLVPGTSKHGTKHLSGYVTRGPAEFLAEVFQGWMDGDGHSRRSSEEAISVSHHLAMDMYALAQAQGWRPVINTCAAPMNRWAKTRQRRWSVTVCHGGGANMPRQEEAAVWRKVMTVETEPFEGWVYNLSVEGDESYVAEGLGVHNCTGFAAAHCLNAEPARALVRPEPTLTEAHAFDFYRGGSRLDPWPGAWEPEDTGSSGLAVCQHLRNIGRIPRYEWAFGFQHGLEVISYAALMQGTYWPEGMFHPDADGRVRPTGPDAGGHEYLWAGVEVRSKLTPSQNRSWFLNSWGRWGKDGAGWFYMTWDDHEPLLARQGDLIRPAA